MQGERTPQEIARGLSAAQAYSLMRIADCGDWARCKYGGFTGAAATLLHAGHLRQPLVERKWDDAHRIYRATDLGRAVAAILRERP